MDIKKAHAREFTDLEAGANAGAVGFWFRAIQAGRPDLAVAVWDATIFAEHYLSLLDNDPANRAPDELATLTQLVMAAKQAQQDVIDAENPPATTPPVIEHDRGVT